MASGCLGLVSFPREPGRVSLERLRSLHPDLLPALCRHPGIGFVLVRSEQEGAVVLGPRGTHHLDEQPRRGRGPARPVRAERGRARAQNRRLPPLRGPDDQQRLRPGGRRSLGLRGAGRLPRRAGGDPVVSLRPAPRRPRAGPRKRWSAPNGSTGYFAAGWGGSDTPPTRPRWTRPAASTRSSDLRRQLRHPPRELTRRSAQRPWTQAMQEPRVERPPVDRHDDPRLDQRRRARRSLGIHMARARGSDPSPRSAAAPGRRPAGAPMPSKRSVSPAK